MQKAGSLYAAGCQSVVSRACSAVPDQSFEVRDVVMTDCPECISHIHLNACGFNDRFRARVVVIPGHLPLGGCDQFVVVEGIQKIFQIFAGRVDVTVSRIDIDSRVPE